MLKTTTSCVALLMVACGSVTPKKSVSKTVADSSSGDVQSGSTTPSSSPSTLPPGSPPSAPSASSGSSGGWAEFTVNHINDQFVMAGESVQISLGVTRGEGTQPVIGVANRYLYSGITVASASLDPESSNATIEIATSTETADMSETGYLITLQFWTAAGVVIEQSFRLFVQSVSGTLTELKVPTDVVAEDLARDSDGNLFVLGHNGDMSAALKLRKFLTSTSSFDPAFGGSGTVSYTSDSYAYGTQLAFDQASHVLIAARHADSSTIALAVTKAGAVDLRFASGGSVKPSLFGSTYGVRSLSSTRNAIVSGVNGDFAMSLFNNQGALDTSFNSTGSVTIDFPFHGSDRARAVFAIANGNYLVVGEAQTGASEQQIGVARLTASGALDTSFSGDGLNTVSCPAALWDSFVGAQQDSSGNVWVAAYSTANGSGMGTLCLMRFDNTGALTKIGLTLPGQVAVPAAREYASFGAMAPTDFKMLSDGRMVVVGSRGEPSVPLVATIKALGSLTDYATTDWGDTTSVQRVAEGPLGTLAITRSYLPDNAATESQGLVFLRL